MSIKRTNGQIGEDIIIEYIEGTIRTDNWFDSEKDGIDKNGSYEVKTNRLNHNSKSLWIDKSQFKKIDGVNTLYFVQVPEKLEDGIQVYKFDNPKENYQYITKYNSNCEPYRLYNIKYAKYLFTVNDSRVNILYENSKAMSKHERFIA